MKTYKILASALSVLLASPIALAADFPPIQRVLPPEGLEIPAEVRTRLEKRLAETTKRLEGVKDPMLRPDVEIFTKAVELALLHREFYVERDFQKADWALDEANKRLDALTSGQSPWTKTTGLVVEGYRSSIDNSAQPYGLVIPENHDLTKPCPLYVWLHGRGDKNTDLHFLYERATRPGQITPPGAIVVHPFGRHCVGWKHAGEIDVLEVVEDVKRRYQIDADRVVLIGFSMGGAGAWHIGAHYTDRWIAVSPGAGFAETARYQRLTPERYPPPYEQTLWGLYDVPNYVRNLFNTRVIAYSGELDKQIQAARVMEEAYQSEGRTLEHLIGPGVEHQYEPETLKELLHRLDTVVKLTDSRDFHEPHEVHLQTRTLRYNRQKWVAAMALNEHWKDARVDAQRRGDQIRVQTQNVSLLQLTTPGQWGGSELIIDGKSFGKLPKVDSKSRLTPQVFRSVYPLNETGREVLNKASDLHKWPGLQGPIDDAFMAKFVVVAPTGNSRNPAFQAWCAAELAHFKARWRALMRAELPVVNDSDVVTNLKGQNLILWGDADSNQVIGDLVKNGNLPVTFDAGRWKLGESWFDGNRFVPALVYPCQLASGKLNGYFVLNSGLTFREGHDRTNSQQNPKLPDWAIIDITQPPDNLSPGRIHDADFFDEEWKLKRQPKEP